MANNSELQSSGMLSIEQLLYLFDRFCQLTSQPDVKQKIVDAVNDKQEAVAVTTAIQEGIFLEMGVDPSFGISCLGKVNMVYETNRDLMIRFYKFVANIIFVVFPNVEIPLPFPALNTLGILVFLPLTNCPKMQETWYTLLLSVAHAVS
eukprot:XP_025015906.1 uncharacterized protein LOC8288053 isoform X2 [Ricinus communis]